MPELPEVETVRSALAPLLIGERFARIITHVPRLRTPLTIADIPQLLHQPVTALHRRAKYLLFEFDNGYYLLNHLGMSGSWRLEEAGSPLQKHDHAEFLLASGRILRYHDPRRFGILEAIPTDMPLAGHPYLQHLGAEPLSDVFTPQTLIQACRDKKKPIKNLLMDNRVVVGVGNIYASEALFLAGIRPQTPAGSIAPARLKRLHKAIREVLLAALQAGGTTIRSYSSLNGREGQFARHLWVYGRAGEPCEKCQRGIIRVVKQAGRSSFYCPVCQR